MANLTINLDTETQVISVSVNDEEIPNVSSVSLYKCCECYDKDEEYTFCVYTNEDYNGVKRTICLTASQKGKPSKYPGLVVPDSPPLTKAQSDIVECFSKR